MPSHEYMKTHGQDPNSEYHKLLKSIERDNDPGRNTVLIVDDERTIRRKVARDIQAHDPEVVVFEAGNGREALEKLSDIRDKHERNPLFIVLDLNMPVMDGWQFIDTLRKEYEAEDKHQGIPIIVLSSTSGETGMPLFKKSVHGGKSQYSPMITVAKEACINSRKYDATGEKGLVAWIKYFLKAGGQ